MADPLTQPNLSFQQRALHETQRVWLNRKVADLQARRWHGTLEIKITDGKMTMLDRHDKEVPPQE